MKVLNPFCLHQARARIQRSQDLACRDGLIVNHRMFFTYAGFVKHKIGALGEVVEAQERVRQMELRQGSPR